jgi:hypothetical protein
MCSVKDVSEAVSPLELEAGTYSLHDSCCHLFAYDLGDDSFVDRGKLNPLLFIPKCVI